MLPIVLLAAFLVLLLDLILDPVMVAGGYWTWSDGGRWGGVPWQNFVAWFGFALVVFLAANWLLPVVGATNAKIIPAGMQRLFAFVYPVIVADLSVTAFQRRLPLQGVLGTTVALGALALLLMR